MAICNCFRKFLNFCFKYSLVLGVVGIAIIFAPSVNFLLDIEPKSLTVPLPNSLRQFETNKVQWKSFENVASITGPDSIVYDAKTHQLITGSEDGYLYSVDVNDDRKFKKLFKLVNDELMARFQYKRRPRPIGLRFDSKGRLFVCEPMFGIFKVENVFTDKPKIELIFDIEKTSQLGQTSVFFDDLLVEEKQSGGHVIYVTDVSRKFSFQYVMTAILSSDSDGRILRYDTDTGKLDIIMSNLFFPNSMEMLPDNNGFLLTETGNRTVWKYTFNDQEARVLMTALPGEPDNIRFSLNGKTFWMALLRPRTKNNPLLIDHMMSLPKLRKLLVRSFDLIGIVFDRLHRITSISKLQCLSKQFRSMEILNKVKDDFATGGGMLIEIDSNGRIIRTVYQTEGTALAWPTEAREIPSKNPDERLLYIGSFRPGYPIRKIILNK
ncbi:adipocyte plasma membrane-associated protein-like protein [Euroglyphus maynei]|uniref:Adipocyte plasma membrane-associated protein-like protein n=1 Tax=Euroglyphus maynei TaxID=6958 RepID=A0A1Y3ATU2_EURMA|nr:adipocyte plasma membrane-associated protein-like protein [Euroglyphus maynei]